MELELQTLAMYPFLKEASDYIKENGPSLDEILKDRAYDRVRLLGKMRVLEAIENAEVQDHGFASDVDRVLEILSYAVARILVSSLADPYLIRRYALSEGKLAYSRLQNENIDFVIYVSEQLDIQAFSEDGYVKVHFSSYLKSASQLKEKEWKLANQDLDNGFVKLDLRRFSRLIQPALQNKIEGEMPLPVSEDILEVFKDDIKQIKIALDAKKSTFKAENMGKITVTRLPPCMRKLLAMAQAGENLPHSGRFALTAFLHTIGMSSDEIIKVFSASPDFDEGKSRYQIDHITGEISGTEYTPPECSTMKSYGICFDPDSLCKRDWMSHPLTYYRIKGKKRKGRDKEEKKGDVEEKVKTEEDTGGGGESGERG